MAGILSFTRRAWPLVGLAAAALALGGCSKKSPAGGSAPAAAQQSRPAPTEEESRQFAAALEKAARAKEIFAINELIDWDEILQTATSGIDGADRSRAGFISGCKVSLNASGGFAQKLAEEVGQGGSFRLLRIHTVGNEQRALFRLLLSKAGVNYHEMVLARRPDGKVRAARAASTGRCWTPTGGCQTPCRRTRTSCCSGSRQPRDSANRSTRRPSKPSVPLIPTTPAST